MDDPALAASPAICPQCGSRLAPTLPLCPSCGKLIHSEELKALAAQAERLTVEHQFSEAMARWRRALELLPEDSRQFQTIVAKIAELERNTDAPNDASAPTRQATGPVAAAENAEGRLAAGSPKTKRKGTIGAIITTILVLLAKFKFIIIFALTKAKLLLLGLTKMGTLFSMLLSLGVYWSMWGWKFALGIVVSIYIHEMGHVAALRRYGFNATAPMFIPGLGAFIRLKQRVLNPREDARIGLAGPIWGLGAAIAAASVFFFTRSAIWGAIAHFGAWVNLFNLLPIWQLDGGRGFRAMTRTDRWLAVGVLAGMWMWTSEGLLILLLIVAAMRALTESGAEERDSVALFQYIFLIIALGAMCLIQKEIQSGNL